MLVTGYTLYSIYTGYVSYWIYFILYMPDMLGTGYTSYRIC